MHVLLFYVANICVFLWHGETESMLVFLCCFSMESWL